jgi:tetratricopeptide (TPR) repeat protein
MSSKVWAGLLAMGLALGLGGRPAAQTDGGCGPRADAALSSAAAAVAAADGAAAAETLRQAYADLPVCEALGTASWSWHGWLAAAQAAVAGGTEEALAPVRAVLAVLERGGTAAAPDAAYAAAVVHAAAAAAQDERDEMRVWLEHAAALSLRLLPGMRQWPMPFAVAEGEVWLVVDDHEQAEVAFERALAQEVTAAALRGLARARMRRGDTAGACAAFRRALGLVGGARPAGPIWQEADAFLRPCR